MKKFFIVIFFAMAFIACSNDDDVNTGDDLVVGTWGIAEINNLPVEDFSLGECNKQSYITFNADNTTNSKFYANTSGECVAGQENTSTWNNESGIYTFTLPIEELQGFNTLSGTINFNGDSFTFTPAVYPSATIVFEKK